MAVSKDKKRLSISIPNDDAIKLDDIAKHVGVTKSQLVTLAIICLASWDIGKDIGNSIGEYLDKRLKDSKNKSS